MENGKISKKVWLDKLYYDVGKQRYDFYLCGLKKVPDGSIKATKWKRYSEVCFGIDPWEDSRIQWVNQRQILPNELVLDIEEPEKFLPIVKSLNDMRIPFKAYETGSRGFHISLIFKDEINEKEKLFYIKKFGVDEQKAYTKTMIALENCPHWKTGRMKRELTNTELEADLREFRLKMKYEGNPKPREITAEQAEKEWREKNAGGN